MATLEDAIQDQRHKTENTRLLNYCIAQLSTKVALPVVKLFGLVEALVKRFEWLSLDIIEANRKLFWKRLVGQIMKSAAFALAFVAAASWAVPSTLTGSLALGPLVAYLACGERFRTCATKITAELFRNVLFVQSLHDLLAVVPNFETGSGLRITEARGQIELRDVSSTAPGANEPTIRNVSLDILLGEKIALVGGNGSGNTTLTHLLSRLFDAGVGTILFDGVNLPEISAERYFEQTGYVGQVPVRSRSAHRS